MRIISHCVAALLRVCAADKGDVVISSENAFRNDASTYNSISAKQPGLREKKEGKKITIFISALSIHIHKSRSSINHAGDRLTVRIV